MGITGTSNQYEGHTGNGCSGQVHLPKQRGFALLLEAYDYAHHVGRHLWDFAVESHLLRSFGLTENDFRWLVCKGYVKHAEEVTRPGEMGRQFKPSGELVFSAKTCFVLTEVGVQFLRNHAHEQASPIVLPIVLDSPRHPGKPRENRTEEEIVVPSWDVDRRELRYAGTLVKQFRMPSPNQEHILMAFEEEHWPPRINDPLPPNPMTEPKQRLRETIRSLNRNQKEHLIRFMGDGTGEGVIWRPYEPNGFHL
jgi:hypothetical protein